MSKFVFFGTGGLLSSICLKELVEKGLSPTSVFIQKSKSPYPNLTEIICKNSSLDFHFVDSVNSPESLDLINSYKPDFGVIASFGEIFKKPLIGSFPIFNVHMGVLPYYRGAYTNLWKILDDHDEYGMTIHEIDEKIDSGKVLMIREKDFSTSIYSGDFFRSNYKMAAEALIETITDLDSKRNNSILLINSEGKYYPKHSAQDMILNPDQDILKLHKKINRLQFYGHPTVDGYQIHSSELLLNEKVPIENYSISSVGGSSLILKNKTGILLLKYIKN